MHQRKQRRTEYYLDVSDYIISDPHAIVPSPRRTPAQQNPLDMPTPHGLPITIEVGGVELSPYFKPGSHKMDIQFFDFTLEGPDEEEEEEFEREHKLEEINEEDQLMESSNQHQQNPQEVEAHVEIEYIPYNPTLSLPYFNEAFEELKKMGASKKQLREFVLEYFTTSDLERHDTSAMSIEELKEVARYNLRYVGPISWLERKSKVRNYMAKKNRRIWKKKISYDCRKRVADNRLRVKGKFVTKKQVCSLLGVEELEDNELKHLLEMKGSKSTE